MVRAGSGVMMREIRPVARRLSSPRLSADNRDLLARVGVRIGIRIGDGDGGGDGFFVLRLFLLAVEVAFGMIGVVQVGFQVMRNRFLNAVEIRDVQYLVGI